MNKGKNVCRRIGHSVLFYNDQAAAWDRKRYTVGQEMCHTCNEKTEHLALFYEINDDTGDDTGRFCFEENNPASLLVCSKCGTVRVAQTQIDKYNKLLSEADETITK